MSGVFLCWRIIFCRSASGKCGDVHALRVFSLRSKTIRALSHFPSAYTCSSSYSRSYAFVDAELRKRRPFGRRFLFSRIIFCRSASGKCSSSYSKVRTRCGPLTLEYCSPSFPSGKAPSFDMGVLITPPLPAGDVVLKCGIEFTSRGECCSPSFPSGIPPPLGKSAVLLKCGIHFSSFLIKFESRIEIIERRTV